MTGLLQMLSKNLAQSSSRSVFSGERRGGAQSWAGMTVVGRWRWVGASFHYCPSPPAPKELTQSSGEDTAGRGAAIVGRPWDESQPPLIKQA